MLRPLSGTLHIDRHTRFDNYDVEDGRRYNADNSAVLRAGDYRQRHDQEVNGNRLELTHLGEVFGLASDWAWSTT